MRAPFQGEIARLRAGKTALRQTRREASIEDKLRDLVRVQQMYVSIVGSQRTLQPWQRPWSVLSHVRDSVLFNQDAVTAHPPAHRVSAQTRWIRPTILHW